MAAPGITLRRWLPWLALAAGVTAVHAAALGGGSYFLDVYLTETHPHLAAVRSALLEGRLPFWSGGAMLGYPLAANPQVGAMYPPHLILLLLLPADRAIVFSVWLHSLVAAGGVFALGRRLGVQRPGAVAGGLLYACAPFIVFYHQAIHGLVTLALAPAVVLAVWRASDRPGAGRTAVAAAVVALQLYAGHLQLAMYTMALALLAAVLLPADRTRRERLRAGALCGLQIGLGILLYGPQLLPAYELWTQSLRHGLTAAHSAGSGVESFGWDDLVEVVLPRFFGGPSLRDFWYPEFLGAPAVLLAVVGARRRDRGVRLVAWAVLMALTYLVAIRIPGVTSALGAIPGLSAFRAPGRVAAVVLLGVALLAGAGVAQAGRARWLVPAALALAALGLAVGLGALDAVPGRDPGSSPAAGRRLDGWELSAAAAVLLAAAWFARRPGHGSGRVSATLFCAAAAGPVLWVAPRYAPTVARVPPPPLLSSLAHPGARVRRVLGVSAGDSNYMAAVPGGGWPGGAGDPSRAGWNLQGEVGAAYGLRNLHGQTSLPLRRFVHRWFGADVAPLDYPFQRHPPIDADLLAHAGVTHVVAATRGQMPVQPRPRPDVQRQGYTSFRLTPRAPARLYPLDLVLSVRDEPDALAAVRRTGSLPDVPLVAELPGGRWVSGHPGAPLDATLAGEGDGVARIRTAAAVDTVLLYAESWYPGWSATVDGAQAPVFPVDGAFIGVPLAAGAHRVELRFASRRLVAGLVMLAVGLLALIAPLIAPVIVRRRRRAASTVAPS